MSYDNVVMYGAVIPSFDSDTGNKKRTTDDKRYDSDTAEGWASIIREAGKMK